MNRANTSPYWKRPDTPSNPSLFDPHQSALLSYLGDQGVADHDLWHPLGEFENVVPHPVRRLLIGGKRFIRAVKPADSDQHVWATVEQIIAPESGHLSQQGQEALLHAPSEFLRRAVSHPVLSNAGEHVVPCDGQPRGIASPRPRDHPTYHSTADARPFKD
jgi:hypothetical protein